MQSARDAAPRARLLPADACTGGAAIALPELFFELDTAHPLTLYSNGTLLEDSVILGRIEASGCVFDNEGSLVARWTPAGELLAADAVGRLNPDPCVSVHLSAGALITKVECGDLFDRTAVSFAVGGIHTTRLGCRSDLACIEPLVTESMTPGVPQWGSDAERKLGLQLYPLPDYIRSSGRTEARARSFAGSASIELDRALEPARIE